MARNYEKNFGRLNRLWLEKETGKKEKRPKLSSLKTSEEISYWLPSIKDDLDFYLKQTEVPCYTDRKIDECRKHIQCLEGEYKAFVRKLHQLNSGLKSTPWTPRPYESKASKKSDLSLHPMSAGMRVDQISSLPTPVLMHDSLFQDSEVEAECTESIYDSQGTNDEPLFPNQKFSVELDSQGTDGGQRNFTERESLSNCEKGMSPPLEPFVCAEATKLNPLGLDYSSSEDEG